MDTASTLAEQLASAQAQLAALQDELDETNHGVVALYAELDTQAQQLQQATELKSRFLAYMSHEFRTPISSIRSLTQLLLDRVDGPLTPEQNKQITFIRTTCEELADMVNDLLDLAKVEAGRIDISPGWFELLDLFAALRGMFKPVLVNPDVVLVFEDPQGDATQLFTDDRKLSQILRNFIANALKFTTRGEVRVSAVQQPGTGTITFSVSDTGIGIAPEFHETIFEDFTQIDSPIQKRLRGTGLGLSLSRRMAELLGGTVGLHSTVGHGLALLRHASFAVGRPGRCRGAMSTPPPASNWDLRAIDRSRYRLLIVNDDPIGRYATVRQLGSAGFPTLEAANGAEALALADESVAAMVLDIHLPDIDGFEVCRRLRERPDTARLPIIHLTAAYLTDEDKVRGLDAGADAYLTHPVEAAVLVSTIQSLVRTRDAEDARRRSEAKFRAIYAQAPSGICVLSTDDGRILDVNPAMLGLLQRGAHQVIGHTLRDFRRCRPAGERRGLRRAARASLAAGDGPGRVLAAQPRGRQRGAGVVQRRRHWAGHLHGRGHRHLGPAGFRRAAPAHAGP